MKAAAATPAVAVADSVTALGPHHAGCVLVAGSHGGLIAAWYAAQARVRAAVFNDAGRGLEDAGIAGLAALEAIGMAAAAVAHTSARIGDAADSLAHGTISCANAIAQSIGVVPGLSCRAAAELLRKAPPPQGVLVRPHEARHLLLAADERRSAVIGLDSIGQVVPDDARAVLVIGSHGGLHGGDPASALPVRAVGALFHDAGRGKDDAGTSRLPVLARLGVAAATADYRSARIGDARSLWATGAVSCLNESMRDCGVAPGMRVRDAVERLRDRFGRVGSPPGRS